MKHARFTMNKMEPEELKAYRVYAMSINNRIIEKWAKKQPSILKRHQRISPTSVGGNFNGRHYD